MMNVIKAVWMAKYLLTATIGLILIAIYFFAVFSVLVLKSDYDKTLSGSCENVWFCSVTIFDSWYKADGTIGGWLDEEAPSLSSDDEYNTDGVRIASDFVFNFIIGILLLEIFSGILTDTFAKIRSEHEELNSIQESRCFVCNKESNTFPDFKHHTKYVHNFWDYVIYIYTLIHSKDSKYEDFSKPEAKRHIWKKFEEEKIYKFKYEDNVEGAEYLEEIIDKNLLLDNSDDYVKACLAHYELAGHGQATPLELKRYLDWLPYNLTSMEETRIEERIKSNLEKNAKSTREEFKKEVNQLEERMNEKINEMKEMMDKILDILKKK
jgi:hypothetical protein